MQLFNKLVNYAIRYKGLYFPKQLYNYLIRLKIFKKDKFQYICLSFNYIKLVIVIDQNKK